MRYLITGGAGFIGSHLAEALLDRGDKVHVLDDLSTGAIDNIRHLKGWAAFEYTIDSAANAAVVAELVDWADVVYHLAAAVGVKLIVERPVHTIETNVHCTEVVLSQANKKSKPVLVASTSEVYGKSPHHPYREDGDLVLGPTFRDRWAYACSKAVDEFLALAYWKEKRLPTVIARLFNTVGPRQTGRYGMVVPTLARQAIADRPLTVFGDGTQRRCFCHVSDTVSALVELMGRDDVFGHVFNIGSQEEVSILDLARMIRAAAGSNSEIVTIPYQEAYEVGFEDMHRRIPDTSKLQKLTGWRPTRSLETTLDHLLAYERSAMTERALI